jgi:amidohydrolase
MRVSSRTTIPALLLLLVFLVQTAVSIPFASKTKQRTADEETADSAAVRDAASEVSKTEKELANSNSPVVEEFFRGNEDESSSSLRDAIRGMANTQEMQDFLQTTRRSLHRKPELMYELPVTSQTIQSVLDELGIDYTAGWAKNTHPEAYPGSGGYGIVAHIGNGEEPCVILRADMDALPILEATEGIQEYKSKVPGKMHACGHDGHVTMLLGAAALLKNFEANIKGTIRLVFQPAEEGGAGMKRMVEEGLVELEPKAKNAFGIHVWPTLPSGTVASRPGALMAAAEMFEIAVQGKGGHAAMPHLTIDPIVAAASFVANLQSIVSRTVSPLQSGVVSVTQFTAGDAFNVIPASVTIKGTIRALSNDMLMSMRDDVVRMLAATDAMHSTNSTIKFAPDFYPPTVNDPELFEWSKHVGALVSREQTMRDVEPTMGGEDFSFLAEAIPSVFFLLGQGTGGDDLPRTDYGLHHPSFALDEHVLTIGVELHANLALRALKQLAATADETAQAEL